MTLNGEQTGYRTELTDPENLVWIVSHSDQTWTLHPTFVMAASFRLSYPHCCKRAGDVTKKRPASLPLSYKCRARSAFSNSYYVPDKEASILNSKWAQILEQPPQSQEAAAPSPPSGLGCLSPRLGSCERWGADLFSRKGNETRQRWSNSHADEVQHKGALVRNTRATVQRKKITCRSTIILLRTRILKIYTKTLR